MSSIITGVVFVASLLASVPLASAQEAANSLLTVPLPLNGIEVTRKAGTGFAVFHGAPPRGSGGQPALPSLSFQVLLPPDTDVRSVRGALTNTSIEQVTGSWQVDPMSPEFTPGKEATWPMGAEDSDRRDLRVYRKDESFPSSHLQQVAAARFSRWLVAEVIVRPFRFNPVTGTLLQLKAGDVLLSYRKTDRSVRIAKGQRDVDSHFRRALGNTAVNFDSMVDAYRLTDKRR